MEQFQSLVTVAPWTFIFTICNLLLQMLLVKKFLFKPVQKILDQRAQEVGDTYAEADQAKTEAESLRAEYEQRLATAKQEASEIVKTATATAAARSEQMIGEARAQASAMKSKADAEIAAERKKAAGELKNDISTLALDIAGKVVEKELDGPSHQKLIDEFIQQAGDAS